MQSTEALRRKINSAEDLLSVVKTMKGLAVVNIRHYERAVESVREYSSTIEMGLHIVLSTQSQRSVTTSDPPDDKLGYILFGSDQGLCGQFNERIVDYMLSTFETVQETTRNIHLLTVGGRTAYLCSDAGWQPQATLTMPGGITGISPLVQELLFYVEQWRMQDDIEHVRILHNRPVGTAHYEQTTIQLLPVDLQWLRSMEVKRWPSRVLPTYTMNADDLFAALIRQHMYVVLYQACAESLAAENAARVASMQNAADNIAERLEEYQLSYHRQRQYQITAELLDIVSGFDAVMHHDGR